jgi:hypothetical protein
MSRSKPTPSLLQDGPVLVDPTQAPTETPPKPHFQTRYPKAPRPRGARRYLRNRLAEALPEIADSLIDKAIAGGLPELKVLIQVAGLDEKEPPANPADRKFGGRYFEDILIEQWRKERDRELEAQQSAGEPLPGEYIPGEPIPFAG